MRLLLGSVLCFSLFTAFSLALARRGRALAFRKGSTFFYRLNYKITSFEYTPIFAQVAGFKVAWMLPSSDQPIHSGRSLADVHEVAQLLYQSHGFDGKSCLLKNICQASEYVRRKEGVISKILKLLAGPELEKVRAPYCHIRTGSCPLRFIGLHSFTER